MDGKLLLIVGNSGTGKDSLLAILKQQAGTELRLVYPKRWITRNLSDPNESYHPVTLSEFVRKIKAGDFFIWWEAYEYLYGIDQEAKAQLQSGNNVVLNVSRQVVAELRQYYPLLTVIQVEVSPETVFNRLRQRGRGRKTEIQKRLARAETFQNYHEWDFCFPNDGDLQNNGRKFVVLVADIIKTGRFEAAHDYSPSG